MWLEVGLNFGLAFIVVFVAVFGLLSLMQITYFARLKEELLYFLSRTSMVAKCGTMLFLLSLSFAVFSLSSFVHAARDYSATTSHPVKAVMVEVIREIPGADEPLNPPLELNLWRENLTGDEIQTVMDGWQK